MCQTVLWAGESKLSKMVRESLPSRDSSIHHELQPQRQLWPGKQCKDVQRAHERECLAKGDEGAAEAGTRVALKIPGTGCAALRIRRLSAKQPGPEGIMGFLPFAMYKLPGCRYCYNLHSTAKIESTVIQSRESASPSL